MLYRSEFTKAALLLIAMVFCQNIFCQIFDNHETEDPNDTIIVAPEPLIVLKTKSNTNLIDSMVMFGKTLLGTRYRYGGTTPSGFDCSGFVQYVYKNIGIGLPRTGTAQYKSHIDVEKEKLKKGDIVCFQGRQKRGKIGHVGIVVSDSVKDGNFSFIHASLSNGVIISSIKEPYYSSRYLSACRVIDVIKEDFFAENSLNKDVYHTVARDETIYSIAKLYNSNPDTIRRHNNHLGNNIKIGQSILIKKHIDTAANHSSSKTEEQNPNSEKMEAGEVEYLVKKGDTLYSISNKFKTSVQAIKQTNKLSNNRLKVGQKLKILLTN